MTDGSGIRGKVKLAFQLLLIFLMVRVVMVATGVMFFYIPVVDRLLAKTNARVVALFDRSR